MSSSAAAQHDPNFRRSHQKSRAGCGNCKSRRIKCDETKPACGKCSKRKVRCQYLDTDYSPASSAPGMGNSGSTARIQPPCVGENNPRASSTVTPSAPAIPSPFSDASNRQHDSFNFEDYRLLHHYSISACHGLADDPTELDLWQIKVPHLAFAHPYVLHLLLAISALHLARREPPAVSNLLTKRADHHYGAALPHVINLLPHMTADNAEAVYIAAVLICFCHFARGPKPGDYIAFSDEGEAEWFTLLRGVRSILRDWGHVLANGVLAANGGPTDGGSGAQQQLVPSGEAVPEKPRLAYRRQYRRLRELVGSMRAEDASFTKYEAALDTLENCFAARYQDSSEELHHLGDRIGDPSAKPEGSKVVFAWLYLVPDDFVASLQAKRPVALVIYAHYIVLMKDLEGQWLFEGWVEHILEGIERHIHPMYEDWLSWPRGVIRS